MYKNQMLLQRIACFFMLIACALVFIYSLGITTDLYGNKFQYYAEDIDYPLVEGSEIYYNIQPFNRQLTTAGLVLFLLAASLLVFQNHARRKYYFVNYVTVGVNAVAGIGVTAWALPTVISYKEQFLQVDFETLKYWAEEVLAHEWTDSTFWFDAAYVVFGVLMVAIAFLLFVTLYKVHVMRAEKAALRSSLRRSKRQSRA